MKQHVYHQYNLDYIESGNWFQILLPYWVIVNSKKSWLCNLDRTEYNSFPIFIMCFTSAEDVTCDVLRQLVSRAGQIRGRQLVWSPEVVVLCKITRNDTIRYSGDEDKLENEQFSLTNLADKSARSSEPQRSDMSGRPPFDVFNSDSEDIESYLEPKIHKRNNPGRPIVSAYSCPTELISQYSDQIMSPFVKSLPSYIKDTFMRSKLFAISIFQAKTNSFSLRT